MTRTKVQTLCEIQNILNKSFYEDEVTIPKSLLADAYDMITQSLREVKAPDETILEEEIIFE